MTKENRIGQDRRSGSREQIATLVTTRTETLALYTDLAGRQPFSEENTTVVALQRFCQALIDYAATAHFQLYRHIEEKQEKRGGVNNLAEEVYPKIMETTEKILSFNDKYQEPSLRDHAGHLADDLSQLGEALADRIQLEDQVIHAVTHDRRSEVEPVSV